MTLPLYYCRRAGRFWKKSHKIESSLNKKRINLSFVFVLLAIVIYWSQFCIFSYPQSWELADHSLCFLNFCELPWANTFRSNNHASIKATWSLWLTWWCWCWLESATMGLQEMSGVPLRPRSPLMNRPLRQYNITFIIQKKQKFACCLSGFDLIITRNN